MSLDFIKAEIIDLKKYPMYNEKWLQTKIEEDPSILGLDKPGNNLQLWSSEQRQPQGGRIDTIMYNPTDNSRYIIEVQLGKTDESHIIRTIEYWDNERKKYPRIKHFAVIIAEEITSRFFNVISLFNGHIPLIAIQVKAIKIENTISLFFTKILEVQEIVSFEEDNKIQEPTDRDYWLKKSSKESMELFDQFIKMYEEYIGKNNYIPKYNKVYIGLGKDSIANNYIYFTPQKKGVIVFFKIDQADDIDNKIEESGLRQLAYDEYYRTYKIKMRREDFTDNKKVLDFLVKTAYDRSKKE